MVLTKDFNPDNCFIRCRKCGKGKPKDDFKGSIARVCIDCRNAAPKGSMSHQELCHFLR